MKNSNLNSTFTQKLFVKVPAGKYHKYGKYRTNSEILRNKL